MNDRHVLGNPVRWAQAMRTCYIYIAMHELVSKPQTFAFLDPHVDIYYAYTVGTAERFSEVGEYLSYL